MKLPLLSMSDRSSSGSTQSMMFRMTSAAFRSIVVALARFSGSTRPTSRGYRRVNRFFFSVADAPVLMLTFESSGVTSSRKEPSVTPRPSAAFRSITSTPMMLNVCFAKISANLGAYCHSAITLRPPPNAETA